MKTDQVLDLTHDQVGLFGYGSLISVASMERTLGRPYAGPFILCAVEGWRRTWDISMPNQTFYTDNTGTSLGRMCPEKILYLNVQPDSEALLTGALFVVHQSDLDVFDRREWIYDRVEVTPQLRGVAVRGGNVYFYIGKAEHRMTGIETPHVAAVRTSYLQILKAGLASLGDEFRTRYEQSSDPVPLHLVIEDKRDGER